MNARTSYTEAEADGSATHDQLGALIDQLRANGWTRAEILSFVTAVVDGDA